ncbi:MAG: AMP-binding protein, partial [Silvanigrellaceae bacterium]|nr:AMP-binding protein [Silvanigrellaceae bacterium]
NDPYPVSPKPVAQGELGELYLAGAALALGYVGNEINQQRFRIIVHPELPGVSLSVYQTGDIVSVNPEGNLIFCGRADRQIKFMGERFHPGGIEQAIKTFPKEGPPIVTEAIVLLEPQNPMQNTTPYLTAFIEVKPRSVFNDQTARQLSVFLKHHPGCVFVPSRFKLVQEWPRNINKKIDVKALASGRYQSFFPAAPIKELPQEDTLEKELALLWQDVLSISSEDYQVRLEDDFLMLGGTSLTKQQLIIEVREKYAAITSSESLSKLKNCTTLREMATCVRIGILNNCEEFYRNQKITFSPFKWLRNEKLFEQKKNCVVILVHSVLGDAADDFSRLLEFWPAGLPLLGVQSPALSLVSVGYAAPSMQALARDYLSSLGQILMDYEGPVIFLGYSAGGTLAYEMARQYGKNAFVCGIDTPSVYYYKNCSFKEYADEFYSMMDVLVKQGPILSFRPETIVSSTKELCEYSKDEQLFFYWESILAVLYKEYQYQGFLKKYHKAVG